MTPRRALLFGFVLVVLGSSAAEIATEFAAGEPLGEMWDDVVLFAIAALIAALFVRDWLVQQRTLESLRAQLDGARGQLAERDADSRRIASEYREVVQRQFDAWELTPSEQEVVLGLLKGLSFRELAELRGTREKTVRQHAANVYRKAGVAGRHELAAWFFEDLLGPGPVDASGDITPAEV